MDKSAYQFQCQVVASPGNIRSGTHSATPSALDRPPTSKHGVIHTPQYQITNEDSQSYIVEWSYGSEMNPVNIMLRR